MSLNMSGQENTWEEGGSRNGQVRLERNVLEKEKETYTKVDRLRTEAENRHGILSNSASS